MIGLCESFEKIRVLLSDGSIDPRDSRLLDAIGSFERVLADAIARTEQGKVCKQDEREWADFLKVLVPTFEEWGEREVGKDLAIYNACQKLVCEARKVLASTEAS